MALFASFRKVMVVLYRRQTREVHYLIVKLAWIFTWITSLDEPRNILKEIKVVFAVLLGSKVMSISNVNTVLKIKLILRISYKTRAFGLYLHILGKIGLELVKALEYT